MAKKLWSGRFSKISNPTVEKFTSSISFDRRLYPYDIQGSMAHVQMLAKQKIIASHESKKIVKGLHFILKELESKKFRFKHEDEDIHMAVERRLHEIIGPVAGKLHTARSRNDQVILDVRLFLRDKTKVVLGLIGDLQKTLVKLAEKNISVICPGFTHLQHAQPILLSHYYLAYYEMFERDYQRFTEVYHRINVLPLGTGALAGTNFSIDRHYVAKLLDFPSVSENSLDTIADRDFILDFLSASAILQMHLSRLAEELVLWSSTEFGFIELPDEFCTGSSIMPQKKNPDVAELTRGKTGRVYGNLVSVLTTMKGLPLTYNSDMQEDKPPLFDSVDTITSCLTIISALLKGVKIKKDKMRSMAETGFITATNLANYLSKRGVPFREAHHVVGSLVKYCEQEKMTLDKINLKSYKTFHPKFEKSLYKVLTPEYSIESTKSYGGSGSKFVKLMLAKAKKNLKLI
jgi:argininosuccinate lyase